MAKKDRRRAIARILHVGCNAMDSNRILTIGEILKDYDLTEQESRLLYQRYMRIKKDTDDIRKIARHIERGHRLERGAR